MIPQFPRLEISRSRLHANVRLLKQKLGPARLCAVIKADAYGHGVTAVVPELMAASVGWFCFYSLPEALHAAAWFRHAASEGALPFVPNVLVLAPVVSQGRTMSSAPRDADPRLVPLLKSGQLRLTVIDEESAGDLNGFAAARRIGKKVPVHVQVDTGLTRGGVAPGAAIALLQRIENLPRLQLEGVFAHFSHGDEPGHPTVQAQVDALAKVAEAARRIRPDVLIHTQNSGGVFHRGDLGLDMARVGIAVYGLQPSTAHPIAGLLPVAQLTAPILAIHETAAGTGVGYGHTFTTKRASRLAIVPVGYADGYPRTLSNKSVVQVQGAAAPVVGRVSMDQIIVDVTDVAGARPGDVVTVYSRDPKAANAIDQIATATGTIGYEIATRLGSRVARVVVE